MAGKHAGPLAETDGTEVQKLIRALEVEANALQAALSVTGLGPDQIRRRTHVLREIYRLKALQGEMRRYTK